MARKLKQSGSEHQWAAIYREWYDSATVAEFTRVSKSTIYYALRTGALRADPEYTRLLGKPIVTHAELLRWMASHGLSIPGPQRTQENIRDLLTAIGAARVARVSHEHVRLAIESGRLRTTGSGRILRQDLRSWIEQGRLINVEVQLPQYLYHLRVGAFMRQHGLTASIVAARTGNAMQAHEIQRLMGDTLDADWSLLARLAAILDQLTNTPIAVSDLIEFRRRGSLQPLPPGEPLFP